MNFSNEKKKYCVYAHINKVNGKIYIGITSNLKNRWRISAYDPKQVIRKAFDKYGWDGFDHIVLITDLTHQMAMECEKELIKKYNTMNKKYGYNRSPGGEIVSCYTGADSPNSKVVYQYDFDGNFIRKWGSIVDAQNALGLTNVAGCCHGRNNCSGNWQWKFYYSDHIDKYIPPDYSKYSQKEYPRIYQYTCQGDFIKIIEDIHDEFNSQYDRKCIIGCCKGCRASFDNNLWFFEDDVNEQTIQDAVYRYLSAYRHVIQFTLDGIFVKKYEDAEQAAQSMGGCKEAINHACSGSTRKAFGYQWRYERDCEYENGVICNIAEYVNPNCKTIVQFDTDGNLLQYWESTYKANKFFGNTRVTNALHQRKDHYANGFLWFFADKLSELDDALVLYKNIQ